MTPLTREQVELLLPLTNLTAQTVNTGGKEGDVGIYTALLMMIDHDAALRAEIVRLEAVIERLEEERLLGSNNKVG